MTTDELFVAKNRLEFTRESFAALALNTDWSLVDTLWVYDDGSVDGTREWLTQRIEDARALMHLATGTRIIFIDSTRGSPAAIMLDYLYRTNADAFAKVDNDTIVPPRWLNECVSVMESRPLLDLLGIEPPKSRTPHYAGGKRSACPDAMPGYAPGCVPCGSIGGIGLMRVSAFMKHRDMAPYSIYGGFTEWQIAHADVMKAWITPPLNVFLLDRLPTEPWASLSRTYIADRRQRAWSGYDPADPFWSWWQPAFIYGPLAQRSEQRTHNPLVASLSLAGSTK